MAEPRFTRVLIKLSGESLMGSLEYGVDPERVQAVAGQIARRRMYGSATSAMVIALRTRV